MKGKMVDEIEAVVKDAIRHDYLIRLSGELNAIRYMRDKNYVQVSVQEVVKAILEYLNLEITKKFEKEKTIVTKKSKQ